MHKYLSALLTVVILLLLSVGYVFAQEPTAEATLTQPTATPDVTVDPPPVDVEEPAAPVANLVTAIVAGIAVLLTNVIVTVIKSVPYLANEDKDKLAVAVTQVVAIGAGILTGYVVSLVAQGLGLIADDSIRNMVIAVLTPILSELRYRLEKMGQKPVVDFPVHTA